MGKKKTHDEYVQELKEKNPDVEVVGTYVNAKTKIKHHCLIHDVYWMAIPDSILQGCGCLLCKSDKLKEANLKDEKTYVEQLKNVNPNVVLVGKYVDAKTLTLHQCKKHNIKWLALPTNVLRGHGCPSCKTEKFLKKTRKTHEEYISELSTKNPNVVPIEQYININTPILHRCLLHNIEWNFLPSVALKGCGCKECMKYKIGIKNGKTHEKYISELSNINKKVIVLDKYKNANTPILHKCLIDGTEWIAYPSVLLRGGGCPTCNKSRGEKRIGIVLDKQKINYTPQYKFIDCKDKKPLSFDFYLSDYNMVIEYQGEQHYRSIELFGGEEKFKIQQKHDKIKKDYCEKNNISFLEIPYWEFDNIEDILIDCLKLYENN